MMGALTLRLFFLVLYLLGDDGSKTLEAAPSGVAWCEKRHLFWSFPYVCPEPVLAKRSLLNFNGAKIPFFAGASEKMAQVGMETFAYMSRDCFLMYC